jgi:hypothetical protein
LPFYCLDAFPTNATRRGAPGLIRLWRVFCMTVFLILENQAPGMINEPTTMQVVAGYYIIHSRPMYCHAVTQRRQTHGWRPFVE